MAELISAPTAILIYPAPTLDGEIYVEEYVADEGDAAPGSPIPIFWQSAFTTKDGTLIEFGAGDHQLTSDNGVREYNPVQKAQTYVYPNNNGAADHQQYDNLHYFYCDNLDSLVFADARFFRGTNEWLLGSLLDTPNAVVGTGDQDLFVPVGEIDLEGFKGTYNAHQAWSSDLDAGVCIAGGLGGDSVARNKIWLKVPASGLGAYVQPYAIFERVLPDLVDGAAPYKISGRDGCCFAGDYVYWVGGMESLGTAPTPHFFRMRVGPHLTSTGESLEIERLPDAPDAFVFGLLRYDPSVDALLCISDKGMFAYDLQNGAWSTITPSEYIAEFAGEPMNGLMPNGCLGDYVGYCDRQLLQRTYFRPGFNHSWGYDYGGTNTHVMYTGFRSIRLGRKT